MKKAEPLPLGTKQVLIAFRTPDYEPHREHWSCTMSAEVRTPFLPLGLFLWDVTDATFVVRVMIGNLIQAENNGSPIPGRYFTANYTFEELQQLAARGELELSIEQRQVLEMSEARPGSLLTLQMRGPFTQACLWGLTYSGDGPTLHASIERRPSYGDEPSGYTGRLLERRLRGEVLLGDVTAPTEASVCALIAALRPRH